MNKYKIQNTDVQFSYLKGNSYHFNHRQNTYLFLKNQFERLFIIPYFLSPPRWVITLSLNIFYSFKIVLINLLTCIISIHKLLKNMSCQRCNLLTSLSPICHTDHAYSENSIRCGLNSMTIHIRKKKKMIICQKL